MAEAFTREDVNAPVRWMCSDMRRRCAYCGAAPGAWRGGGCCETVKGFLEAIRSDSRHRRDVGEQPESAPVSVVGCPYCQRVPCEDQVHALWRAGRNGSDV